jgi:hypothetical protein
MDRFHRAPMLYSMVFAREMTLDETELKTHLRKSGLRGGAARQPVATTAQEALNWARCQTFIQAPCA